MSSFLLVRSFFLLLTSDIHIYRRNRNIGNVPFDVCKYVHACLCVCVCVCEGISGWKHYLLHVSYNVAMYCLEVELLLECVIHLLRPVKEERKINSFFWASFERSRLIIIEKENSTDLPVTFIY